MNKLTVFTEDKRFSISLTDKKSCDKMFLDMMGIITEGITCPAPPPSHRNSSTPDGSQSDSSSK